MLHTIDGDEDATGDGRGDVRVAVWRFTLAVNVQALRLVRLFAQAQSAQLPEDDSAVCPECHAPLHPDGEASTSCAACAQAARTPPESIRQSA